MAEIPFVGSPVGFVALATDPTGTWPEGSVYWNYVSQTLRVFTNGSWISTA